MLHDSQIERGLHESREELGLYDVPCNGCTRCCRGDAVRILPHENAHRWQTEPHPYLPQARMFAHRPNGDCVYLGVDGCTRHTDKPQQCREMDCRRIAQALTFTAARKLAKGGQLRLEVWERGRELLRQRKAEIDRERSRREA